MAGLANFGGGSGVADIFTSLVNEATSRTKEAVNQAVDRAQKVQDEKDSNTYEQWKAGKISDTAWLNYIKSRIKGTSDYPDQQSKWEQLLLENQDAIGDAQAESNFAIGKLSLSGLIEHYRQRMDSVNPNSPAWRDLATRYGQLINARGSGSGSGSGSGGGGGGGSSSGSSGASLGARIDSFAAAQGSSTEVGYRGQPGLGGTFYQTDASRRVIPLMLGAATFGKKGQPTGDDDTTRAIKAMTANNDQIQMYYKWFMDNPGQGAVDLGYGRITRAALDQMARNYFANDKALAALQRSGLLTDTQMSSVNDARSHNDDFLRLMQTNNEAHFMMAFQQVNADYANQMLAAGQDQNKQDAANANMAARMGDLVNNYGLVTQTRAGATSGSNEGIALPKQEIVGDKFYEAMSVTQRMYAVLANPTAFTAQDVSDTVNAVLDLGAKYSTSSALAAALGTQDPGILNAIKYALDQARSGNVVNTWNGATGWRNTQAMQRGSLGQDDPVEGIAMVGGRAQPGQVSAGDNAFVPILTNGQVAFIKGVVQNAPDGSVTVTAPANDAFKPGMAVVNGVKMPISVVVSQDTSTPGYYVYNQHASQPFKYTNSKTGQEHDYEPGEPIATEDIQDMAAHGGIPSQLRMSHPLSARAQDGTVWYYNDGGTWTPGKPNSTVNAFDSVNLGGRKVTLIHVASVEDSEGAFKSSPAVSDDPLGHGLPYMLGPGVTLRDAVRQFRNDVQSGKIDDNTFTGTDAMGQPTAVSTADMDTHIQNMIHTDDASEGRRFTGSNLQAAMKTMRTNQSADFVSNHGGADLSDLMGLPHMRSSLLPQPQARQDPTQAMITKGAKALGINIATTEPDPFQQAQQQKQGVANIRYDALQAQIARQRNLSRPDLLQRLGAPSVKQAALPIPPQAPDQTNSPLDALSASKPKAPPPTPLPPKPASVPNYSGKASKLI